MQFRIADTFTASLRKLDGQAQKAAKDTAFEMQLDPANPGMQLHRIDRSRDDHFWSVRASRDIRLIVHKTASSLLLCYVDHHDKAYAWAERRRIETHPNTGAAQIVELRETTADVVVPNYVQAEEQLGARAPLFSAVADDDLLAYGVPTDWLAGVRAIRDEGGLFQLIDHLPAEASEALIELATGGTPTPPDVAAEAAADPFEHPDAQRRFRTVSGRDELAAALDYPWDKWTIFLHPAQKTLVERVFNGPARVSGSAGTGKTVVALHRAVFLARQSEDARILLTTFNDTLANALRAKLRRLLAHQPRLAERVDVAAIDTIAHALYEKHVGPSLIADADTISEALTRAADARGADRYSHHFLATEWRDVVDAWQLTSWEDYRGVQRRGRQTRLPESGRQELWAVFENARETLRQRGLTTLAMLYARLSVQLAERRHPLYDHIVVDEAQDISIPQLRFLAAMAPDASNSLFFAGDLGQRIFQTPFSWASLGVAIRGRSTTLKINYRTSQQIRASADRLLDPEMADVDGNCESRAGTISLFEGPTPMLKSFDEPAEEAAFVANWLRDRAADTEQTGEIAVIVRSEAEIERGRAAIEAAGLKPAILDQALAVPSDAVALGTMHRAKGLEFRALAIMACDDEVIPSQPRLAAAGDAAALEEIYATERHLLYVAMTRARDELFISGVAPVSEFLEDIDRRT
ncbi:3'-5' exonuclease [Salinisphaera sp.]|uniref:3'-5' exonuclease n=1 Tax=Salinisphaera sp. TaxID=1914330 RepID=UPI002D78EEA7|nr:3'-5' exonuclease [Salinisphaera sp.]HET7313783.1 3'-5' exonuclease [Salinisphaera sp.]